MGRLGRIYYSHYVWLFDGHTVSFVYLYLSLFIGP